MQNSPVEKSTSMEKDLQTDSLEIGQISTGTSLSDATVKAEARIIRKFDYYLMPCLMTLQLLSFLDRSNIGNAKTFGFEESLNLVGDQYNLLVTLFYVTYVLFEVPYTWAVKYVGANYVLGAMIVMWSVVTIGGGFVTNFHTAMACRLILGFTEAGLFPAMTFYISMIYAREQQAKRIACLYGMTALSGAFGGLIATGIQSMGERLGLEAWRWLYIVEGCFSLALGCIIFFCIPKTPLTARFLNTEEKEIMAARIRRFQENKEEKFTLSEPLRALKDPLLWLAIIALFASSIALFGFSTFAPVILRGIGYTPLQANYLTVPIYIFATIVLFIIASISDKYKVRGKICMLVPIPTIIGYSILLGATQPGVRYFACYLAASGIYIFNGTMLTWVSNNMAGDYKRATGIAVLVSAANISGALSGQIYYAKSAPRYIPANAITVGCEVIAILGSASIYFLLKRRNAKKDKLLAQGVTDNGLSGDEALNFRYVF